MMRPALVACVWLGAALIAATAAAQPTHYALIVTNNRSQTSTRPDLHYADDDGVQYATLFADLLGPEHVTLLTQLDAETAALHPNVSVQAPTHANLRAAVEQLARQLRGDHASGQSAVVYLVFAGHGDIERGQGYLDLMDGKLTAHELEELVIEPLPAERIHLILDSCNSYFMLNPRKPGGQRWHNRLDAPRDLLAKYPHVGAILSTSAEAVTYEWSELQSGVFSYEVRAGLRGAADVNADGRITYGELSSFIRVANRPIVNDLYRPKVFSRAPAADSGRTDALLAQLPASAGRRLTLGAERDERLTLRDPQGVRVMDIHQEAGTPVTLTLPSDVSLRAAERVTGAERPEWIERDLPQGEHILSALAPHPSERSGRGEPPLFDMLFAEPFGKHAFELTMAEMQAPDPTPSGVTQRDVDRLRLHLSLAASTARDTRTATGLNWIVFVSVPMAALTYGIVRYSDKEGDWATRTGVFTSLVLSLVGLGFGASFIAAPWKEEGLYERFEAQDLSTESARSREVPRYERDLKTLAQSSARERTFRAWFLITTAVLTTAAGGFLLAQDVVRHDPVRVQGPLNLAIGLGEAVFGLYLLGSKSPLENNWLTYSHDPAVQQRAEP